MKKKRFIGIPIALLEPDKRLLGERGEAIAKFHLEEHGWKVLHNTVPEEMSTVDFTEVYVTERIFENGVERWVKHPQSLKWLMSQIPMEKVDFILRDTDGKSYFADVKAKSRIKDLGWIDKKPYEDSEFSYLKFAGLLSFIVFFYIDELENRSLWRFDLKEPRGEWLIGNHYMVPKNELKPLPFSKSMQNFIVEFIKAQRPRWEPKLANRGWSKWKIDELFRF